MTLFNQSLRPEDVGELIDLAVKGDQDTLSMATMQLEGVAALYNILCKRRCCMNTHLCGWAIPFPKSILDNTVAFRHAKADYFIQDAATDMCIS